MALEHLKPNEALMADLMEIRELSLTLEGALKLSQSKLPNEFPKGPVEDMLESLKALPDGTAAECRPILHAAEKRLAKLRHKYFRHKPPEHNDDDRHVPATERGQSLDAHTAPLRQAIGTALEECRQQEVGELSDEDFDPWGYDQYDNEADAPVLNQGDRLDIHSQSKSLENDLKSGREEVENLLKPESETGDTLKRVLTDAENLNRMGRAELEFANGSTSIRKDLNTRLKNLIPVTRKVIGRVKKGLDYAEPVHAEWKRFKKDKSGYVLNKVKNLVENIDEKLVQLEDKNNANQLSLPPIPEVDQAEQIKSEEIAEALLRENKAVPDEFAKNVRHLRLLSSKFTDLNLLSNMTWLQTLDAENCSIWDVTPLKDLKYLNHLDVMRTQVTDITPLTMLTALDSLYLDNTPVADITTFTKLTALKDISLSGTAVVDFTTLAKLTGLHTVYLDNTKIIDITPLAKLTALEYVELRSTQVTDITPLAKLTALQRLDLSGTQVADITPLVKLTALERLDLVGTKVTDISPLAKLTALNSIDLSGLKIEDITPLAKLTELEYVFLSRTQVSDWSPLDHIDDVGGRPEDWVRKPSAKQS